MNNGNRSGPSKWTMIILFVLIAILLTAGGYWFYRNQVENVRKEGYKDLKVIAELKLNQIIQWRNQKIADAGLNSKAPFLRSSLQQWLKKPNDETLRSGIMSRLQLIKDSAGYENVMVAGIQGNVLLTFDPRLKSFDAETKQLISQVIPKREIVLGDFFRCSACRQVHLDIATLILDQDQKPLAVLILRTEPEKYLYPLIQSWPTASKSAESLLVEKRGKDVWVLSRLLHRPDPALTLRFPLSEADRVEVQAVQGKTGLFEGMDYRRGFVLTDLRPIPNTSWHLVTKMDREEILAEAAERARLIGFLTLALVLLSGAGTAFWYKHQGKRVYQALYRSERERTDLLEQARVTLYSIGDAVITTGSDSRVQQMNPVAEELTGWKEAEAIGKPLAEVFHIVNEETRLEVENPVNLVLQKGLIVGLANHTLLISKDGTQRPIADSGAPIRNKTGEIIGVVLVFRDQTEERKNFNELKQTEAALRQSEERYRTILEETGDGYFEMDLGGHFTLVNDSLCRILGYSREELLGMSYKIYTPPEELEMVFQSYNRIYRTGEPARNYNLRVIRKDGSIGLAETSGFAIHNERGEIIGFRGIRRDITERRRAEEEREKMTVQLQQAQKMESIGRLAGGVAHDFNNLLTAIIGNVELALMDEDRIEVVQERLEEIRLASEKAAVLTQQLLAFSRKQVLQPKIINLNEIVLDVKKMLGRLIGEDIALQTFLAPDLGRAEADPGQLEQVIINLAVNARDALPNGGRFTIETVNIELDESYAAGHVGVIPGSYVMLSVSDNGIGMSPDVRAQIFDPFFTTKEKGKGTGLGLATVYGIIKQSKGNIWVYSEKGQGTTFKIYLPRVDKAAVEEKKKELPEEVRSGTETVLVVEDDENLRQLVVGILQRYGYTVLSSLDGPQALALFTQSEDPIHLLLTDVVLPGMNGRELAELLEKKSPGLKALYMSGYTDNAIVHHGILDEGIAFLQKPFTPDVLARKVREVLDL